ncbi:hypothetical protein EDD27_3567 [Nonomuraea polychroma]|uniref:Uncharacterized protein n=1 Tax=Nonomuraea polychroma TaxID=46176 RepID=A0A438M606_9ACTN|nr:hypothetical protein EDD27_3567 [Nonomuraea polychroma]
MDCLVDVAGIYGAFRNVYRISWLLTVIAAGRRRTRAPS